MRRVLNHDVFPGKLFRKRGSSPHNTRHVKRHLQETSTTASLIHPESPSVFADAPAFLSHVLATNRVSLPVLPPRQALCASVSPLSLLDRMRQHRATARLPTFIPVLCRLPARSPARPCASDLVNDQTRRPGARRLGERPPVAQHMISESHPSGRSLTPSQTSSWIFPLRRRCRAQYRHLHVSARSWRESSETDELLL